MYSFLLSEVTFWPNMPPTTAMEPQVSLASTEPSRMEGNSIVKQK